MSRIPYLLPLFLLFSIGLAAGFDHPSDTTLVADTGIFEDTGLTDQAACPGGLDQSECLICDGSWECEGEGCSRACGCMGCNLTLCPAEVTGSNPISD
ncbi:MAG: hypothetical protein JRI25_08960 [Deltaproteobacteria bacterium]|nr:hypothetical protein [Deltaproteobacteria bacterium]MBW2254710.1 hypothetical protein [Deltaproteobacteria bacterium]